MRHRWPTLVRVIVTWADQELARLREMFAGRYDVWYVPRSPGRGYTWCARPAGAAVATVNVESVEELIEALAGPVQE
jgi:hypothetical protein